MKRSWKKQWINQLDKSIPDLREDVLNAPIPTALATKKEEEKSKTTVVNNTEKTVKERWSLTDKLNGWLECFTARLKAKSSVVLRMTASAIAVLAVCMVALEALPLGGGVENVSAYALEINPQAVFTTDGEGIVTAVVAGNADADVILSSTKRKSASFFSWLQPQVQTALRLWRKFSLTSFEWPSCIVKIFK